MRKYIFASAIGGIGLWCAAFVALLYISWQSSFLSYIDCSGMNPCTDEEYAIYVTGLCLGFITGVGVIIFPIQYIVLKRVYWRLSLLLSITAVVVAPIVLLATFFIMIIPMEILVDIQPIKELSGFIALIFALAVSGIVVGRFVLWLVEKNKG